ncbi:MAG TPA: zinc ribbon domain-containing protein [Thermoanaerobaculia bacterium]
MDCPKCGFAQADDRADCARCGVVFARLQELEAGAGFRRLPLSGKAGSSSGSAASASDDRSWRERLGDLLRGDEGPVDRTAFWARTALWAFLALWGARFLLSSVRDNYVSRTFLHLVNLPFHEAGHVIFSPFGEFLHVLGGTLGQLLIPAICLATFLLRNRDPFAASVCLFWLAENFMDIAPYIADASVGQLPLLGGVTGRDVPGYHDWENILDTLNLMRHDLLLGNLSYALGRVLMLAALGWGGWLLLLQKGRMEEV